MGKRKAGDEHPGVGPRRTLRQAPAARLKLVKPLLVLELGVCERGGVARAGVVVEVEVKKLVAKAKRLAVATADKRLARHHGQPAQVRPRRERACELQTFRRGIARLLGGLLASLCAHGSHFGLSLLKEHVVTLKRWAARCLVHPDGVKAVGVQRDGFLKHAMRMGDDGLGLLVSGKGQLVVDEVGRRGYQVEGSVGIGLGQRVAVLGKTTPKARVSACDSKRLASIERLRKAQRHALVIFPFCVKRQGPSFGRYYIVAHAQPSLRKDICAKRHWVFRMPLGWVNMRPCTSMVKESYV